MSFGTDLAAEVGDKSQLLVFLLALRLRSPVAVVLGMAVATIVTHGLAGEAGLWLAGALDPVVMRCALGLLFIAVAAWTYVPKLMERMTIIRGGSAFATAALSYCVAETGGKTYLMTAALSAQTGSLIPVVVGTVLGEVLINAPLIFLGQSVARRLERGQIDLTWIARAAAVLLAAMGVAELVDAMLL